MLSGLAFIIALLGYPSGLLIARLAKDELSAGIKWFKLLIKAMVVALFLSLLLAKGKTLLLLTASFLFILLLALASLIQAKRQNALSNRLRA